VPRGRRRSRHTAPRKRYGHPGRFRNVITRLFPSEPGLLVKHITRSLTMSLPERVNSMTIAKSAAGRDLHVPGAPHLVVLSGVTRLPPATSSGRGQPARLSRRLSARSPAANLSRGTVNLSRCGNSAAPRRPRRQLAVNSPRAAFNLPRAAGQTCPTLARDARPTARPDVTTTPARQCRSVSAGHSARARATAGLNEVSVTLVSDAPSVTEKSCSAEFQGSR
jgi:hypothetical protein